MKQDFKKEKIQSNYRKQLQDKGTKHYNKEIIITAIMLAMILLVYFLFDYKPFQNKDIQIREIEIKKQVYSEGNLFKFFYKYSSSGIFLGCLIKGKKHPFKGMLLVLE